MQTTLIIFSVFGLLLLFLIVLGKSASKIDWGIGLTNVIDGLLRLFVKSFHRFKYEPIQLPEHGAAIVVANHISGLDPFLLVAACQRPIHFMVAKEEYERFGQNWLFKISGCVPVDRENKPQQAFRETLKLLDEGKVVALFPHGTIQQTGKSASRLKRGVAKLAELSGAPVYPAYIDGVGAPGTTLLAMFIRSHATLKSYPPLNCSADGGAAFMQALDEILNKK